MHIVFCLSNFILNFLFELPQFTHTEWKYLSPFVIIIGRTTRAREARYTKMTGKTICFKLWDTNIHTRMIDTTGIDKTEKVGITLLISLVKEADKDIPRSTFIRRAVEKYILGKGSE